MSKKELLPCPFCGSKARLVRIAAGCAAECTGCGVRMMLGSVGVGWYATDGEAAADWNRRQHSAPAAPAVQHSDDAAVDRFAAAMKEKLAAARAKGRAGWDDPNVCPVETLAKLLISHLRKGNAGTFEDVANFAMMLHQRGADPRVLAEAAPVVQAEPVAWQRVDRPERIVTKLSRRSVAEIDSGVEFIPLYTAPQPAEKRQRPPAIPAQPDAALVEALWKDAVGVASGLIVHAYNGSCPDAVNGHDKRDEDCPACQVILRIDAAMAGKGAAK